GDSVEQHLLTRRSGVSGVQREREVREGLRRQTLSELERRRGGVLATYVDVREEVRRHTFGHQRQRSRESLEMVRVVRQPANDARIADQLRGREIGADVGFVLGSWLRHSE